LRRLARTATRAGRGQRNEIVITVLYAVAGALCLALAALLIVGGAAAPAPALRAATPGNGGLLLRDTLIGAVLLGALGVLLLGLAWRRRPGRL